MSAAPLSVSAFARRWHRGLGLSPASALAQDVPPEPPGDRSGGPDRPRRDGHRCRKESGSARSSSSRAAWTVDGVVTGDVVVLEGPVTVTGQVNGSVIAADGVDPARRERSRRRRRPLERADPDPAGREGRAGRRGAGSGSPSRRRWPCSGSSSGPIAVSISVLLMGLVLRVARAPRRGRGGGRADRRRRSPRSGWGILVAHHRAGRRRSRSSSRCSASRWASRCSCRSACGGWSGSRGRRGAPAAAWSARRAAA